MTTPRISVKWICVIIATVMLLLPGSPVEAATSSELQKQIDVLKEQESQLQQKLDALETELSDNAVQMEQIVQQKHTIDQQVTVLHEQLDNTNAQITAHSSLIADKQEELEEAEEVLSALQAKHKTRIRAMEEQGTLSYWSILFKANSFADLLDRLDMINEIAAADNRRLEELRQAARQVQSVKEQLQTEKISLEQTRDDLEKTQQTLHEKRTQADSLLRELVAKGAAYETLLEEGEAEQDQLMQELAQLEDEYDEAAYQEWLSTSVPSTDGKEDDASQSAPSSSGWRTPVPYYTLTSPFGMRFHPILNIWRMHNGVDMACAANTPIYASRSGVVTTAAYQEEGAGNYVQLDHGDGYRSIYMHMTRYIVSPGQYVTAGQTIGYVGNTGLSKGNHLHFGISHNGTYVNPMEYLP